MGNADAKSDNKRTNMAAKLRIHDILSKFLMCTFTDILKYLLTTILKLMPFQADTVKAFVAP